MSSQASVSLADRLLSSVGSSWADRVFFSDDGSTAVEVALKMAFRKFMHDRKMDDAEEGQPPVELQASSPPAFAASLSFLSLHSSWS
jgi:hypothetical protein